MANRWKTFLTLGGEWCAVKKKDRFSIIINYHINHELCRSGVNYVVENARFLEFDNSVDERYKTGPKDLFFGKVSIKYRLEKTRIAFISIRIVYKL